MSHTKFRTYRFHPYVMQDSNAAIHENPLHSIQSLITNTRPITIQNQVSEHTATEHYSLATENVRYRCSEDFISFTVH